MERAEQVHYELTRRPNRRRRRFPLVTRNRLKNLSAPLEVPGAELAEIPVIGVAVFAVIGLVLIVVVGLLLGGFLIGLAELLLLGLVAAGGSIWAWLRGHPKVATLEVGDERWIRREVDATGIIEDAQMVQNGADPATIGYERLA